MEDIISKLAQIEAAASRIMDDVAQQKKQLALQYETAIHEFDQCLEDEMKGKTKKLEDELEVDMKEKLDKQRSDSQKVLTAMETYYEERHETLAKQVYNRILRM